MPLRITQRINFSANTIITYFFSLIIIFGSCLNFAAYNSYVNDRWTIGEWLINYQGGFVRRGLLGEEIFLISDSFSIAPIYIIWIICLSSYLFSIKLSFGMVKNLVSTPFLLSPAMFLSPKIGNFLVRKHILLLLLFVCNLKIIKANKSNFIYSNFSNEIKNLDLYKRFSYKFNFLKIDKFSIELYRKSKLLLLFTSYRHCCWSLFYVATLLVVPLYSFLKSEFIRNK